MPKYFDPANFPKKNVVPITIYGSVLTLSGTTTNGKSATININGIDNKTDATVAGTSLTTTASNWVTANYAYYLAKGYKVSSAAAVITVVPAWGWDTVNRIKVTITTVDTLTGSLTGVFEPDLTKAKIWQVKFGQSITIKKPRGIREGDTIRLELKATGAYTTTFDTDAFFFPGGTENSQTSTSIDTVSGTVNISFWPREERVTIVGSSGTASISYAGVTKTATWNTDEDTTASDFVTANAAAYLAKGIVLTSALHVLYFTSDGTRAANAFATITATNLTGDLTPTVVSVPEGRIHVNAAAKDIKQ
jgi:hypothetical protein